jgi:LysM repeat protein
MGDEIPHGSAGQPDFTSEEKPMKPTEKPAPKIPTTQTNTNRKKRIEEGSGPWAARSSLFKKNEATLIIAGALVVTLVVFFVFFRSSGTQTQAVSSGVENNRLEMMEGRLTFLEQSVADLDKTVASIMDSTADKDVAAALAQVRRQVSGLESGFLVKIDSLADQVARLEKRMAETKTPLVTVDSESRDEKAPVKKTGEVQKKEAEAVFHTVQKGETLWRISQKYGTTVARLRELNNLAPDADIYPGTKIVVR